MAVVRKATGEDALWQRHKMALFVDLSQPSSQHAVVALRRNPVLEPHVYVVYLPNPALTLPPQVKVTPTLLHDTSVDVGPFSIGSDATKVLQEWAPARLARASPPKRGSRGVGGNHRAVRRKVSTRRSDRTLLQLEQTRATMQRRATATVVDEPVGKAAIEAMRRTEGEATWPPTTADGGEEEEDDHDDDIPFSQVPLAGDNDASDEHMCE